MLKYVYYQSDRGDQPVMEFIYGLPLRDRKKLILTMVMIQKLGIHRSLKNQFVKKIRGKNIFEIRSRLGNNIQRILYFTVDGELLVLTNRFTKKTQKTPIDQIKLAEKRRRVFLESWRDQND